MGQALENGINTKVWLCSQALLLKTVEVQVFHAVFSLFANQMIVSIFVCLKERNISKIPAELSRVRSFMPDCTFLYGFLKIGKTF